MRVRVCPYCYSPEITEKVLIGGPMAQLDNDDGTYRCLHCGKSGVPIDFAGWEEYQEFIDSKMASTEVHSRPILPMLPTLFHGGIEAGSVNATVVKVTWDGGLRFGDQRERLQDNWKRAEKVVEGKAACILDLNGIMEGRPDLDGIQHVLRRKGEVMLDIGIHHEQDVFDCFTMGASQVLATSIGMPSFKVFERVLDMTDECIPCLCYDDKVQWRRPRGNPTELDDCLSALKELGFAQVGLMCLDRLGKANGPDLRVIDKATRAGLKVWLAGGVRFEDVPSLPAQVSGVLLDPSFE
ncbi:MAG: Histidine biosynthesis protein [Methanomassiliicoccales archaeon PtaU1.Bin124]|nr:MAG: Histidine biosynthesis protein [Methanomassiliicoccales archaeon PtaU1.Bin124]